MSDARKIIKLESSDGEIFEVEQRVMEISQTIKYSFADDCTNTTMPLENVTGKILSKVIQYCKKHDDKGSEPDDLEAFNDEFIQVDKETLFDLVMAANYLNIKSLLDLTCQAVADKIKGKSPKEVREVFNITDDLTPEGEAKVRGKTQWAFE